MTTTIEFEPPEDGFHRVYSKMLANADPHHSWKYYEVRESPLSSLMPTYGIDRDKFTLYLPLEYTMLNKTQMRNCMAWVYDTYYDSENVRRRKMPVWLSQLMESEKFRDVRRKLIFEDLGLKRSSAIPKEFGDAIQIYNGVGKCTQGMAFTYCEMDEDDRLVAKSDYLSRVFLIAPEVFECENRMLRVYVCFRELACACCIHVHSRYGTRPDMGEVKKKYLRYFDKWWEYERMCRDMGWYFRDEIEVE